MSDVIAAGCQAHVSALPESEHLQVLTELIRAVGDHLGIDLAPTNETALHTGRRRWLVTCRLCNEVLHEATTGPLAWHGRQTILARLVAASAQLQAAHDDARRAGLVETMQQIDAAGAEIATAIARASSEQEMAPA